LVSLAMAVKMGAVKLAGVVVVMGRLRATGIRLTLGTPKGYTINPI
jgi:hypothetical protein